MESRGENGFKLGYALSLAFQLGFIIAVPIGGFLLLGRWLDQIFGAPRIFISLGIFTGFAITVYEVYHLLLPLIENNGKNKDD